VSVFRDLVDARARLEKAVGDLLAAIEQGGAPENLEREIVDCKEEAGRRDKRGGLLPGEERNPLAAEKLADEVTCLANTPGGGALVVGIEDGSWQVLGTELDAEWLRHRIYELVDVAPAVEERQLEQGRVLVILVAEASEPVENRNGQLRWRVESHCKPVDRSEWWQRQQRRAGLDIMAATTTRTIADVRPGAVLVARRYLEAGGDAGAAAAPTDEELLRRLGVLRSDGHLTQAGTLLFCEAGRPLLTLARFDVVGGNVDGSYDGEPTLSLLEQLREMETRLDVMNHPAPVPHGFAEAPVRPLPERAVREAVLNGIIHRDWMSHTPTAVSWVDADGRLEVVSPGGFPGAINEHNVLTQREARYPALSDAFRALRLVDKQGVGVDRMYREMIAQGHRPPEIVERPGPEVRCLLDGREPVVPVVTLISAITPAVRQQDVRIAILVYTLLHQPFVSVGQAAAVLQTTDHDALGALSVAADSRIAGDSLLRHHRDVWLLSKKAIERVADATSLNARRPLGLIPYWRPGANDARAVVSAWLEGHDQITSGDYSAITGLAQPNATRALNGLVGDLIERGEGAGRNAHFVLHRSAASR
jgi:ATP-dependent DNA helicase RecG